MTIHKSNIREMLSVADIVRRSDLPRWRKWLLKKLNKAEAVINLYANGCNGSLYFINDHKEDEYRKPARDYFYA